MIKLMSIYDRPQNYANRAFITLEQAKIRCKHFKLLESKIQEARKCPKCGEHTLEFENGSYEEGYGDFICCTNEVRQIDESCNSCNVCEGCFVDCGYTSDVTEQFEPLSTGYDFDIVLYLAAEIEAYGIGAVEKQVIGSWSQFVDRDNTSLIPAIFHCPRCGKVEIPEEIPLPDYCPECGSPPPGIWNRIKVKVLRVVGNYKYAKFHQPGN